MSSCYLGLGSNLRTPARQLHQAIRLMRGLPKTIITKKAPIRPSKPLSSRTQPTYANTVIEIKTRLPPDILLRHCRRIEKQKGRVRKKHWGSRTLDIDILMYENRIIQKPDLKIPHPGILFRDFVYEPLFQLSPDAALFLQKKSINKIVPPKQMALSATLNTGQ